MIEKLNNAEVDLLQKEGFAVDEKSSLIFSDENGDKFLPMPSLLGLHQLENLATALKVASILQIDFTHIPQAILKTKWAGRLQRVKNKNFPKNCEFWFDGAHNQGGAKVLREWIDETKTTKRDYIVIGKSKNSNQEAKNIRHASIRYFLVVLAKFDLIYLIMSCSTGTLVNIRSRID